MNISFELDGKTVLRWALGIIFIWAALSKIANPQEFHVDLAAYRLPLAAVILRMVAIVLPWLELLCGLLLLANLRVNVALLWTLLLCFVFVIATAQASLRGLHISCGCLDLRLIGLDQNSALANFFESPAFAFFRALLLGAAAAYLLANRFRTPANEETETLTARF